MIYILPIISPRKLLSVYSYTFFAKQARRKKNFVSGQPRKFGLHAWTAFMGKLW